MRSTKSRIAPRRKKVRDGGGASTAYANGEGSNGEGARDGARKWRVTQCVSKGKGVEEGGETRL